MNKIQPVNFRSMEDFLNYLPENELKIVQHLREIVFNSIPQCTEKLAYNVPYYYKNSRICFIWPPSVPWGNANITGVQFGFCNGHLLNDEIDYLEKGTRKQVYWKTFSNIGEIDIYLLKSYIYDAAKLDDELRKKNK